VPPPRGDGIGPEVPAGDQSPLANDRQPPPPSGQGGVETSPSTATPQPPPPIPPDDPMEANGNGDAITRPVLIRKIEPAYPPIARRAGIRGDVVIEAVIGPDGRVSRATVVESVHPLLDEAAKEAVLQSEYEPGRRRGVVDSFPLRITVSFRLE
jgi:periplasmic protein TonB